MNREELGKRLKYARDEVRGMSLQDVADAVGVARSTVQRYEAGKIQNIKLPVVESFARALHVNPDWLICKSDEININSSFIDLSKYDNISPISMKKYPLLGEIACGKPIFAAEDRDSYVLSGTDIPADFCLRAKGDSMINARIQDGDIVFIRKQDTVENGEIAAVIIDDEATLKRFSFFPEKDMVILKPENPKYADLVYVGDELEALHVLGKAIAFQSDVE